MDNETQSAMLSFRKIILGGIPFLHQREETAFLSFLCMVAAIDALSGYRFTPDDEKRLKSLNDHRFSAFVRDYFPSQYLRHATMLYQFRCRMLHNFSPAYFSITHCDAARHLLPSNIGDTTLHSGTFFSDLCGAAEMFFAELESSPERQANMLIRLRSTERGGSIFIVGA